MMFWAFGRFQGWGGGFHQILTQGDPFLRQDAAIDLDGAAGGCEGKRDWSVRLLSLIGMHHHRIRTQNVIFWKRL